MDLGDYKEFTPNFLIPKINGFKDKMMSFKQISSNKDGWESEKISEIYRLYQEKLTKNNAFDFGDLILYPIELFKKDKKLLQYFLAQLSGLEKIIF